MSLPVWMMLAAAALGALSPPPVAGRRPPGRRAKPASAARQEPLASRGGAATRPASRPGEGRITYVAAGRGYLDRGAADGLTTGATLKLRRQGRGVGSCQVEWLAHHHATCTGTGLRTGDVFSLPGPVQQPAPAPAALAPAPSAPELARRRAALEAAPYPKVGFKSGGGGGVRLRHKAEAELTHHTWAAATAPNGPFQQERLEVAVQGAELGAGLRLFLDASVLRWSRRPEGYRFPPAALTQVYVHQAELSMREPERPLVLSAGRLRPWYSPGLGTVDGIQAGWRSARGEFEVGLVGGVVPDPVTLAPGLQRPVLAGYLAQTWSREDGLLRWLRHETRVSMASTPELGWRLELETLARAWLGRWADLGASARFGLGQVSSPALLDAARFDVGLRPHPSLRLLGGVRYGSRFEAGVSEPGTLATRGSWLHSDLSFAWDVASWLSVGAAGYDARDLQSGLRRAGGGPELSLPRLLGAAGGLSLGYQYEVGATQGQTAYVQAVLSPLERLRLIARASYFRDQQVPWVPGAGPELGVFAGLEMRVASWLAVRASALARLELDTESWDREEWKGPEPYGLVASGGIGGSF